jgi:hypothetical protein
MQGIDAVRTAANRFVIGEIAILRPIVSRLEASKTIGRMPGEGLEPSRYRYRRILSQASSLLAAVDTFAISGLQRRQYWLSPAAPVGVGPNLVQNVASYRQIFGSAPLMILR